MLTVPPHDYPRCRVCGGQMMVGQQGQHYACAGPGICTCRDDFAEYRQWVIDNVVPVIGESAIPAPCELHGAPA